MENIFSKISKEIKSRPVLASCLFLLIIGIILYSRLLLAQDDYDYQPTTSTPEAPSNLIVSLMTSTSLTLNWIDNSDNEDMFTIERKLSTENEEDFIYLAELDTDTTSFTDTYLITQGMILDYRMKACSMGNEICSDAVVLNKVEVNETSIIEKQNTDTSNVIENISVEEPKKLDEVKANDIINSSVPAIPIPSTPSTPPPTSLTTPIQPINSVSTITLDQVENISIEEQELIENDINEMLDIISGPEIPKEKITDLIYKDSNKDGISDYDSVYVYDMDPIKPSSVSTHEGKKINASEKILLGFDPSQSELVKVKIEQPLESKAPVVSNYKIKEVVLTEKKEIVLKGQALPNSFVTLYIYSTPIVVTIKTDENGEWQYTLEKELEDGKHTVYTATVNNSGKILAKSPVSNLIKTAEAVTLEDLPQTGISVTAEKPGILKRNPYLLISGILGIFVLALIIVGISTKKKSQI